MKFWLLVFTLLCASPVPVSALAGNGETGILIHISDYRLIEDPETGVPILLLGQSDFERVRSQIDRGFPAILYLLGMGVYLAYEDSTGMLSLIALQGNSNLKVLIKSSDSTEQKP